MEREHIMAVLDESIIPVIGEKRYFSTLSRMMLKEMLDHNENVKKIGEGKKITQKQMLERINAIRKEKEQDPYTLYWLKKVKKEL